jgi:CHAT domain-containing protein
LIDLLNGSFLKKHQTSYKLIIMLIKSSYLMLVGLFLMLTSGVVFGQSWKELSEQTASAYHAGRYDEALQLSQETIKRAEQEFGIRHANYFTSISDQATILKKKGNYKEAQKIEEVNLQSIESALGSDNLIYVTALKNLGNSCLEREEFQQAEYYYNGAQLRIGKIINKNDEYYQTNAIYVFDAYMGVSIQLGMLYNRMGRIKEAESIYLNLIEFCKSYLENEYTEYPLYAVLINNISNIYIDYQQFEKAEPFLIESRKLYEKWYGVTSPYYLQSSTNLATVFKKTGRFDQSEALLNETLEAIIQTQGPGSADYIHVLNNMAEMFVEQERYPESERCLLEAIRWQELNFGNEHPMHQVLVHNLAETYQWMNRFNDAEKLYKVAVQKVIHDVEKNFSYLTENEKRSFYLQNILFINEYAYFALLKSGALPLPGLPHEQLSKSILTDLYNLQLNTKALLLNATTRMRKNLFASGDSTLISRFQLWVDLKNMIAHQYNLPGNTRLNLDSLITLAELHESILAKNSAAFRKGFTKQPVTWLDVQKKLKPGEAAVEFIRYNDGLIYAALIITPETRQYPQIALIKSSKTIELEKGYLSYYKNAIRMKNTDTISYNRFWKPVYDTLKKYSHKLKRVYVSPDGIFNEINLNTLQNPVTKKYVLDETEIHLVTNTQEIVEFNRKGKARKGMAVLLGRPSYGDADTTIVNNTRGSFSDLKATEKEVNEISALLKSKSWHTMVLTAENASEEAIKNIHNPSVLHLATHGFFDSSNKEQNQNGYTEAMLQSGILLAFANRPRPDREDGILTAYESMNLELDSTELVVLSACETGLGTIEAGEGVYGLQRTLKVAGAQTILMSLWKVDDVATQELMLLFYKNWLQQNSKRKAFRLAQQELRKKYPESYYWGAFVMTGQ